jgi:hypothetical protein
LQCACLENHDGVMSAATSREAATVGATWSAEASADTA